MDTPPSVPSKFAYYDTVKKMVTPHLTSEQRAIKTIRVKVRQRRPSSATVFWYAQSSYIDYFERGKTIISEYYSEPLPRFDLDLKLTPPHLKKKDSVSGVYTCVVTIGKNS